MVRPHTGKLALHAGANTNIAHLTCFQLLNTNHAQNPAVVRRCREAPQRHQRLICGFKAMFCCAIGDACAYGRSHRHDVGSGGCALRGSGATSAVEQFVLSFN